jgi:hypothetical protein
MKDGNWLALSWRLSSADSSCLLDLSLNIVVVWSQDLVTHLAVSNLRLDGPYFLFISV